jgi:hypothetical protein
MIGPCPLRAILPVALLLLGAAFAQPAAAASFVDSCAAGTGGLFLAKDCSCLDGKVTDADDRKTFMSYFDLNAEVARTGKTPAAGDANDVAVKGIQLIGKYLPQCMGDQTK